MSERMTSIHLPGLSGNSGIAEYGRVDPYKMIDTLRLRALAMKAEAEAILAAPNEDFRIETYRGVYVRRDLEALQKGRALCSQT